ncbi:MAG: hypothetical protein AB2A00_12265 [Myxococcota bacterium]
MSSLLLAFPLLLTTPDACQLSAGTHQLSLTAGGLRREAMVVVGKKVAGAAPVVFAWHGFGGSPEDLAPAVHAEEHWEDAVVVLPRGMDRTIPKFGEVKRPGWQILVGELGGRDLALFDALHARLRKDGCLDERRVYSTGFSNGAFFSNLLACHRAHVLAAIAPVGGGGPFEACGGAVPTRVFHGTADPVVPFESAQRTVETWSHLAGCPGSPAPVEEQCASTTCAGGVEIMFCSARVGHSFGGRAQAQAVAAFLRRHQRPAKAR